MKVHPDFLAAADRIFGPLGLECSALQVELESAEYGACRFELGGRSLVFLASKITPTKIGQFVTCWKRIGNGPILPFDTSDPFDLLIVSCRGALDFGQFVFPKSALRENGIVSEKGKGGKRGIRVYPPWDEPTSRQAERTQKWQSAYFLRIENAALDEIRARELYCAE